MLRVPAAAPALGRGSPAPPAHSRCPSTVILSASLTSPRSRPPEPLPARAPRSADSLGWSAGGAAAGAPPAPPTRASAARAAGVPAAAGGEPRNYPNYSPAAAAVASAATPSTDRPRPASVGTAAPCAPGGGGGVGSGPGAAMAISPPPARPANDGAAGRAIAAPFICLPRGPRAPEPQIPPCPGKPRGHARGQEVAP